MSIDMRVDNVTSNLKGSIEEYQASKKSPAKVCASIAFASKNKSLVTRACIVEFYKEKAVLRTCDIDWFGTVEKPASRYRANGNGIELKLRGEVKKLYQAVVDGSIKQGEYYDVTLIKSHIPFPQPNASLTRDEKEYESILRTGYSDTPQKKKKRRAPNIVVGRAADPEAGIRKMLEDAEKSKKDQQQ